MTKNLFDLTYELATELGIVYESAATGGSTNTVVDTTMRTEADDYWNQGTVWITYDAAGAAAAPQGEYDVVSDFANSSNTITLTTGFTVAPASTDLYAVAHKVFPLYDLSLAINRAIRDIGPIPVTNTTAIDTAAQQTEYTLPIEANTDLLEVYIQSKLSDADDNKWIKSYNWDVQRTATGTADTLVFDQQPLYTYDVKLVYLAPHAKLVASTSKLSETIRQERVIYKAAYHALNHYRMKTRSTDPWLMDSIDSYERRAAEADLKYPLKIPQKLGKILTTGPPATEELAPGENLL
jgi:hypothetical protein